MTGHFPALLSARPTLPRAVGAVLIVACLGSTAGCGRIDKSQWRPLPTIGTDDPEILAGSGSTSTSTARRATTAKAKVATAAPVDPANSTGVLPGAVGGGVRANPAALTVAAPVGTCWVLVVDGKSSRGCGNATITDVRGQRAGRLTKTGGDSAIVLTLWSKGTAIAKGSVATTNHYVTVSG